MRRQLGSNIYLFVADIRGRVREGARPSCPQNAANARVSALLLQESHARRERPSMDAAQRSHEVAAEVVVIHLDGMPARSLEMPMRGLTADPGSDVDGTRQASGDLQRGNARLMIGQSPDAADRLKQSDEEQIVDPRVHHLEIERRRPAPGPVPDRVIEKRKTGTGAGGPEDGRQTR